MDLTKSIQQRYPKYYEERRQSVINSNVYDLPLPLKLLEIVDQILKELIIVAISMPQL